MKVRQLLQALAKADLDDEVILQKDAEGNGFSPLAAATREAVYEPKNSYSGNVHFMHWTAADACMTEADWEKVKSKPRCVVLTPTN